MTRFVSLTHSILNYWKGGIEMNEKRKKQYRELGLMIAYYRKLRGITQIQLAEYINVSRTHISNLEAPNMPTSISLDRCLI